MSKEQGLTIRSVNASLKWGFHVAARLERLAVTRKDGQWSARAKVVAHDTFKITQKPLRLELPHEKGTWLWPVNGFDIADGVLIARLDSPMEI